MHFGPQAANIGPQIRYMQWALGSHHAAFCHPCSYTC